MILKFSIVLLIIFSQQQKPVYPCTEVVGNTKSSIRILALFSGTSNDLGLDHRLGRQVLKLAATKAKQLYPTLGDIDLVIQNDDTDCNNLNSIPTRVAEQFYMYNQQDQECSKNIDSIRSEPLNCSRQDVDLLELNLYLGQSDENNNTLKSRKRRSNSDSNRLKSVDAIIGPSCGFLVDLVARMAAYWRIPIYSVTSIDASFARKDIYSTLTRLSPSIDHLSMFMVKAMEKFKWQHLAIVIDRKQVENTILLENLEQTINRVRFVNPIKRKLFTFSSFRKIQQNDTSMCTKESRETLLDARKVARVFLLLLNNHQVVRRLLLCAYELHMNNGEFTFMALNLGLKSSQVQLNGTGNNTNENATSLPSNSQQQVTDDNPPLTRSRSTNQRSTNDFDWYRTDDEENNLIAKHMFESLMVFSVELPFGDEYNIFVEQSLDMAQQEYPDVKFERSSIGSVAVALHDSLLLAVEAHICYLSSDNNDRNRNLTYRSREEQESNFNDDGDILLTRNDQNQYHYQVPLMWNKRYSSGLITGMHINSNGDQEVDYVLNDLEPELGLMRPVASYSKETRQIKILPNSYIHWPMRINAQTKSLLDNDDPPLDEPECGFNDDADRCVDRQNLYAALSIVAILVVLILVSTSISLYKYRLIKYQMQLDDLWWRVDWNGLQFIQINATDSLVSNAQSVARALRSGGSVVSTGSDGASSFVSVLRPTRKDIHSSRHNNEQKLRKQLEVDGGRNRRTSVVPVIITQDGDKESVLSGGSELKRASAFEGNFGTNRSVYSATRSATIMPGSCIIRSEYSTVVKASNLAMYNKELVIVKQLNGNSIDISRDLLIELRSMREHMNENLAKFVGLCLEPERLSIVYEYCSRGSLHDLLLNQGIAMDWTLKYSILGDIVSGLNFIHTTLLDYHGRLKSTNLVLDSRFTVKITDFGLQNLYSQLDAIKNREADEDDEDDSQNEELDDDAATHRRMIRDRQLSVSVSQAAYNMESVSVMGARTHGKSSVGGHKLFFKNRGGVRYFWTAPEHLRNKNVHFAGSKQGDVYSFAIILFELFTRKEPYRYGTNAKPHWITINSDRKNLLDANSNINQRLNSNTRVAQGKDGSQVSGTLVSSIGRQAKRAQSRMKRGSASVIPQQHSIIEEADGMADNTSIISMTSQKSNVQDIKQSNSVQAHRTVRLSVSAIDEQTVVEENSAIDSKSKANGKSIDAEEILDQLRMGIQPEPVRPYIPNYILNDVNPKLIDLMHSCWNEAPFARPTLFQVRNLLRRITKGVASKNYLDNLLDRLQNYAADLERIVDSKSSDIMEEKFRTEELLYQLVPKFVADRLKRNEPIIPQVFDGVTIFFSDIVGFEKYASVMSPSELVDLLNNIYSSFESIISSFDVTKIETIIDQFLVASGISLDQDQTTQLIRSQIQDTNKQQQSTIINIKASKTPDSVKRQSSVPMSEKVDQEKDETKSGKQSRFKKSRLLSSLHRSHGSSDNKKAINQSMDTSQLDDMDNNLQSITVHEENVSALDMSHYGRSSAEQIARMALCIRDLVKSFHFRQNLSHKQSSEQNTDPKQPSTAINIVATNFNIRIGIHSGRVCAGIVGVKRPKFCLIGDTVNVASRMHTNSKANRIQISGDTKKLLEQVPGFNIEPRGKIEVKGKGMMETFWLESSY